MAKQQKVEPPAADGEGAPVKSKKKLFILIGAAFLALLLSAGGAAFFLMGDAEKMAAVSQHMPLLRNELVLQFSSEEFASLFTPEGKEALRDRATLSVQSILEKELGDPVIESVLFTNIVLQ